MHKVLLHVLLAWTGGARPLWVPLHLIGMIMVRYNGVGGRVFQ